MASLWLLPGTWHLRQVDAAGAPGGAQEMVAAPVTTAPMLTLLLPSFLLIPKNLQFLWSREAKGTCS